MTRAFVRAAASIVRVWTWIYTAGMSPRERTARRAEIASDVWESVHDSAERGESPLIAAAHLLLRLVTGVPDDLMWRMEYTINRGRPVRRSITFALIATVLATAVWVVGAMRATPLPVPPRSPLRFAAHPPPPPPPPPPSPPREDWWQERGLSAPGVREAGK